MNNINNELYPKNNKNSILLFFIFGKIYLPLFKQKKQKMLVYVVLMNLN